MASVPSSALPGAVRKFFPLSPKFGKFANHSRHKIGLTEQSSAPNFGDAPRGNPACQHQGQIAEAFHFFVARSDPGMEYDSLKLLDPVVEPHLLIFSEIKAGIFELVLSPLLHCLRPPLRNPSG